MSQHKVFIIGKYPLVILGDILFIQQKGVNMAIRFRAGRVSPYECYWNNPFTGKRECVYFPSKEEAEKHNSLIKHRLRYDRDSFRNAEELEENDKKMTFEDAYAEYLKLKKFNKKRFGWHMDCMRLALKEVGAMYVDELGLSHWNRIMELHTAKGVKSVTVRARMSVLRTVVRWCCAQGYMPKSDFPKLPPANYEKLEPPRPEELEAIMGVASPHILRVIILGAQLGVRVGESELLRLTWNDVDFHRGVLVVHGAKKNLSAPWREVPIRERLLPIFARWKAEDDKLGISHLVHYKGKPVRKINKAWTRTLKKAGIKRRIRPYDLRHAFATQLIAAGTDIGTVAKLMGHSSVNMVLTHYQYVMDSQKKFAVESLPNLRMCPEACVKN